MNWEIHEHGRPNTREQADVIISLDLGRLDVGGRKKGLKNKFRAGSRVVTPFLHLKFTTHSECEKHSGGSQGAFAYHPSARLSSAKAI